MAMGERRVSECQTWLTGTMEVSMLRMMLEVFLLLKSMEVDLDRGVVLMVMEMVMPAVTVTLSVSLTTLMSMSVVMLILRLVLTVVRRMRCSDCKLMVVTDNLRENKMRRSTQKKTKLIIRKRQDGKSDSE